MEKNKPFSPFLPEDSWKQENVNRSIASILAIERARQEKKIAEWVRNYCNQILTNPTK